MSEEKAGSYKGLTEARKRANKKYNDRFVEIKVRVTPQKRSVIKEHAESMGESATAFINRAIDEAMERDRCIRIPLVETKKSGDVWIHFHTSPDIFILMNLLMNSLRYVLFYIIFIAHKAPICVVFVIFCNCSEPSKIS